MLVTHSGWIFAGSEKMHRLAGKQTYRTVQQCHVDMLSATCPRAHGERGLNADNGVQSAGEVRYGNAHLHRLPLRLARQGHETAHRLNYEIVACFVRTRSRLPEPRNRAINEPGVDVGEAFIVEAEFRQCPGFEVLEDYVG